MSIGCFKGGQSYWGESMDKKPLGCHRAWQGWPVGEGKGPRAQVVCIKIKGVCSTWMCIYLSMLPWEQASSDTSEIKTETIFSESTKNPRQNKTALPAGGRSESSLLDKGPVNHHRGSGGWSKLKQGHNGSLGLHTHTHSERMHG